MKQNTFRSNCASPQYMKMTRVACPLLSYLPVENYAPDEPQSQFVIPINNVSASNIHQLNLKVANINSISPNSSLSSEHLLRVKLTLFFWRTCSALLTLLSECTLVKPLSFTCRYRYILTKHPNVCSCLEFMWQVNVSKCTIHSPVYRLCIRSKTVIYLYTVFMIKNT